MIGLGQDVIVLSGVLEKIRKVNGKDKARMYLTLNAGWKTYELKFLSTEKVDRIRKINALDLKEGDRVMVSCGAVPGFDKKYFGFDIARKGCVYTATNEKRGKYSYSYSIFSGTVQKVLANDSAAYMVINGDDKKQRTVYCDLKTARLVDAGDTGIFMLRSWSTNVCESHGCCMFEGERFCANCTRKKLNTVTYDRCISMERSA